MKMACIFPSKWKQELKWLSWEGKIAKNIPDFSEAFSEFGYTKTGSDHLESESPLIVRYN